MIDRRRWMAAAAAVSGTWPALLGAQAAWPGKPLRIVVVYPPGGIADAVGRLLAERLQQQLGQPVVVENRAGASGSTGMDLVAKAAPDGHTLAFAAISPLTLNPHLMKLPYDPQKDIAPVAQVMYAPVYLVATPAFEGKTLADLLARAKAAPGHLRAATSGMGSIGHVMLEQLMRRAQVQIAHIPYKGGSQIVTDAIGGQFEVFTINPSAAVAAQVAAGKLRVIAVAAPARLPAVAEVPTFAELGYPEANLNSVFGLFAPGRTPAELQKRINAEVNAVLAQPDVRERLTKLDNVVATGTPEAFATLVQREHEALGRIVREAGIRND
ncbi:MAG: tripartite tricarboxylate transporter substrate binding protein [Burkholderiales bacterium]|nr:tripartite tricarboxylate transporter substrate binding protein [Burkholderiales bacterium]